VSVQAQTANSKALINWDTGALLPGLVSGAAFEEHKTSFARSAMKSS